MNKVIKMDKDSAVIDENIVCIPEFKALYDSLSLEDAIKAFTWLHFMYDPESPYLFTSEDEREDLINNDMGRLSGIKRTTEFLQAKAKMEKLCIGPISRLLIGLKASMDKIAMHLLTEEITGGKDGNFREIVAVHKEVKNVATNFNAIESEFRKEVAKTRGNSKSAIDEGETSNDF